MKLPKKIRIKSKVFYEILFVQEFHDCPDTLGECRPSSRQIVLKVGQSPEELIKTFIHECIHALAIEHDIDLKHKHIYALEKPIYQLLKLNKLI